jgi:hypothetical protein
MSIRIPVTVVIEMDDDQQAEYVATAGLPYHDGPLRAKDVVESVRSYILTRISESADLGDGAASVSIKGR